MARTVVGGNSNPVHITGSDADSNIILGNGGSAVSELNPLPIKLGDVYNDAFGRVRVSDPVTIFASQNNYGVNVLAWQNKETASGTATYNNATAEVRLNVTASGDAVIRQTRTYFRYQPGKSQLIFMTFIPGASATGITKRAGYYDVDDGVFLEQAADGLHVVLRTSTSGSPVDTRVAQASWNIDPMDGTGPSGVTLDVTMAQILVIDLQWLGVGRVRVGFDIDGEVVPVHQFLNANAKTSVYMKRANLPCRFEIVASSGAAAHTFKTICTSVTSEGGLDTELGVPFSSGNAFTTRSVTTSALLPICSIRPRALFSTYANRGIILPEGISIFTEDNPVHWRLVYGATLTNASWANVDTTYSQAEKDVAATALTGGITLLSGYLVAGGVGAGIFSSSQQQGLIARLPLTLDIDGGHPTSPLTDSLTLACIARTGSSDTAGMINWRELRS